MEGLQNLLHGAHTGWAWLIRAEADRNNPKGKPRMDKARRSKAAFIIDAKKGKDKEM